MRQATRHRAIVVVHLLVLVEQDVLLLRRPAGAVAGGRWAPPGGHLEPGERPSEAAVRECLEELGIAPQDAPRAAALLVYDDGGDAGFNIIFVVRDTQRRALRHAADAADAARYWPLADLPVDRVPWLDAALAGVSTGTGHESLQWYGEY